MNADRDEKVLAARTRMAELAAKFLDRTVGEVDSLRESLAKLGAGDPGSLTDIRHLAHRMSGTGATLGFETLSDCAMRLESLADAQAPGTIPDTGEFTQLGVALEALGVELDRLRR